jgi:hypothetical protein
MSFPLIYPGDRINGFSAGTWKQIAAAVDAVQNGGNRRSLLREIERLIRRGTQSVRVLVQNDSGKDIDRGEVLGLDRLLIQRDENADSWQDDLDFSGSIPRRHHRSFVITDEPIRSGGVGEAIIEGVANVQVQYRSGTHGFAVPIPNESGWLQSALSGWARIYDVDTTDRLNNEVDGNGDFVDEFPIHWARVWLNPLVNGHPIGEVIQGQLMRDLSAANWTRTANGPALNRREATVSLLNVFDVDVDNELYDQARFQYEVVDWIPHNPDYDNAVDPPHNEIVINYDLRNGSLIQEHWPLHVIDSTGRNGVWTVDADWSNDGRWTPAAGGQPGRYRIPIKEPIPPVLDPDELPNEVEKIDGKIVVPGSSMYRRTDRYELVTNRRFLSAAVNAWVTAIWTGTEYQIIAVSC